MRVKPAVAKHRRLRRILKQVKGYRGARRRRIKLAKEAILRAGANAYVGRRLKKRQFRRLWIVRLNAASRARGLRYSELVNGLKKAGVEVNRKELAAIAYRDAEAFDRFVEMARAAL
ncbi:MAG: 50S ribosomal protein L20 [Planctomycetota bacterium]|jgi:large subunit ribosomal protein L20